MTNSRDFEHGGELVDICDAVDAFADLVKRKLCHEYRNGRRGWTSKLWHEEGHCRRKILDNALHVWKGNDIHLADLGAYCVFTHWYGAQL
jgi:hypothetical protein